MAAGYGGVYWARVVNDLDPIQEHRLQVIVPEIFGEVPVWAVASLPVAGQYALPAVDEVVSVSFERGNTDYPVWEYAVTAQGREQATRGFLGKYHGIVVDVDDPLYERRLLVAVPEVDPTPVWAAAADGGAELPALEAQVWVEYDNGDPSHPRWVGMV